MKRNKANLHSESISAMRTIYFVFAGNLQEFDSVVEYLNFKKRGAFMRNAILYIVFLFTVADVFAQHFPKIRFSHITEKDGLSNNQVSWIEQDNAGFIWFGTADGLDRFDGYKIRSFNHIPGDTNSLVSNGVYEIFPDKLGHIWVSTREGLSMFDKRSGKFSNFRHNQADSNSLSSDQYNRIYIDHDNTAWVTTASTLYHFDSALQLKKIYTGFGNYNYDHREVEMFVTLSEDRTNQIWSSSINYLFLLDRTTKRAKRQFGPCPGNIKCIYQDSQGQYWIGAFKGGLHRFNPETSRFDSIPLDESSDVVSSVTEWTDQNNFRWIAVGTDHGLILLDPVTLKNKIYNCGPEYFQQHALPGNNIARVYVDRQNILWIATDEGISFVEPYKQLFEEWAVKNDLSLYHSSDDVYSASKNNEGMWLTKWMSKDLFFANQNGEIEKQLSRLGSGINSFSFTDITKAFYVRCDGDSVLWITTDQYLVRFNIQKNSVKTFKAADMNNLTGLRTIVPYDNHRWWIRTRNNAYNGLYVFDPVAGKFSRHYSYYPGCKSCPPPYLMDITLTSKKELYVVSRTDGLYKYDPDKDDFMLVLKFEGKEVALNSNDFECVREDKNGILWIGTYMGLIALDPVSKKIVHNYTNDLRIGGLNVEAICFDEQQNLWMNTDRGIFCMIPSTGQIRQFNISAGLPNNLTNGLLFMSDNHFMYSGLKELMVQFKPEQLLKYPPQLSDAEFSEASVMDKPYAFQFTPTGEKLMYLQPGENRFSLDFSVLNYNVTDNNQFYYRLDGVMKNWQQNADGHLAFNGLSPGRYNLHVKGSNKYGALPGREDMVTIIVKPLWWQTILFRIVCAATAIFIAIFLVRRRISNIRRQANHKQKLAEMEMMALRTQMNPHFIFNSLNSIENFIMQNEKRLASDYLNKFARLMRMILEYSREDVVTISKDLEALQLYIDLEQLRFNNKFCFKSCVDKELLNNDYRVPPLLIQPFVENAIMHGLANSDKPDLYLRVDIKLVGEYILYIIEDNGVGRKEAAWHKAQNRPGHKSLGMKITLDRIALFNQQHQGDNAFVITDLMDTQEHALGTRVELKIKPI
jgi:ligand-binding sensor domain-containing protein